MVEAAPTVRTHSRSTHRWPVLAGLAVVVGVYLGLRQLATTEYAGTALNDIAWWFASLTASLLCLRTSFHAPPDERSAWRLFALAIGLWCVGQTVWNYYEVWQGALPAFPHWMQIFFSAYDWVFVAALLMLPRPPESKKLTPRHMGNLLLIVCALSAALLMILMEPLLLPKRKTLSNFIIVTHSLGLSAMFVTALYLLWSHRWRALHWPIVLLLVGAGLHTATYVAYVHDLLTGAYIASNSMNVSWLFVFGAYGMAAYERVWQVANAATFHEESIGRRERVLEALIPALLIAAALGIAWRYSFWLSERVIASTMIPALGFAIVLGLREAWIQRQEQRLLRSLGDANASLQSINRDLQQSEMRYRTLNAELEGRVAARTAELEQAYRELENFSYAVAHDLKAPLRAVDGFGSMLATEYDGRLDETGRHYVRRMRDSALRMSALIDDLLAYARMDRRELDVRTLSLPTLVEKVIQEQADDIERHGVRLTSTIPAVQVRADEAGLLLALRNITQNAYKFSKESQPPRVAIRAELRNEDVVIAISDNGIGFDMTYHDRIFEMFQRLHRADEIPGTGIGLAIVRKAVERIGGKVWAESKPGEGATFYIQLLRG